MIKCHKSVVHRENESLPGWNCLLRRCGHVHTQESSGGGLLSMRPTAGLPALMKCFLSLTAYRSTNMQSQLDQVVLKKKQQ